MNFQDISELINNMDKDPSIFMDSIPQILKFSEDVDLCAESILKDKGKEYEAMLMSVVTSFAMTNLMQRGMSTLQAIMMVKDYQFMEYTLLIVRLTLGLSVMEELR